jgi:hypothetical protein
MPRSFCSLAHKGCGNWESLQFDVIFGYTPYKYKALQHLPSTSRKRFFLQLNTTEAIFKYHSKPITNIVMYIKSMEETLKVREMHYLK